MDTLDPVLRWIVQLDTSWAYGFLFLSTVAENLIPPVPGDTAVIFGAYLVGRGHLDLGLVYLSTTAGSFSGFMTLYYLARSQGRQILLKGRYLHLSPERLARAELWFARYGSMLVLANRFLSGVRSVISITAGLAQLDSRKTALYALLSIALWNGLLIWGGVLLGVHWSRILNWLKIYQQVFGAALFVLVIGLLLRRYRANKKRH